MKIRELTMQEIEAFRRDGYCHIPQLVDHETVTRLLEAADERMANPGNYAEEMATQGRFFSGAVHVSRGATIQGIYD